MTCHFFSIPYCVGVSHEQMYSWPCVKHLSYHAVLVSNTDTCLTQEHFLKIKCSYFVVLNQVLPEVNLMCYYQG